MRSLFNLLAVLAGFGKELLARKTPKLRPETVKTRAELLTLSGKPWAPWQSLLRGFSRTTKSLDCPTELEARRLTAEISLLNKPVKEPC